MASKYTIRGVADMTQHDEQIRKSAAEVYKYEKTVNSASGQLNQFRNAADNVAKGVSTLNDGFAIMNNSTAPLKLKLREITNVLADLEAQGKGNTKEFTGASYIGEWRGMTGGQIVVGGNAGKQCGECLVGGKIHVLGDCDILAGIHMTKGTIEIDGNVNRWPGGQMKNGNIVIHGKVGRLLEGFVEQGIVTDPELDGVTYPGRYIEYKGDIALNGKGTLIIDAEKNRDRLSTWIEEDDEYNAIREYRAQ